MTLFENRESVKPFPCPTCREYLSSDAARCRFCGAEIDRESALEAARQEQLANRLYRRRHYRKHAWRGGGLFAAGVTILVGSYFLFPLLLDTDAAWLPRGLVIGGGADFLYGLYGLGSEALEARRGAP